MKNNKKIFFISLCAMFFIAEAILGYYVQVSGGAKVLMFQYTSVALACAFCLIFAEKSYAYVFTQLGLIFTLGADYFLVHLQPQNKLGGMIFFSFAQIAYFVKIYLDDENKLRKRVHLILRAVLSTVAVIATFSVLGQNADLVAVVSVFYYANLILNLVFSFILFKKAPFMAIGFLCFILCDTVIGLVNMKPYLPLPDGSFVHKILNPGFDPAWAFYVPSQALLATSLIHKKIDA